MTTLLPWLQGRGTIVLIAIIIALACTGVYAGEGGE